MDWPTDHEAETRDATPEERAEHCLEESQNELRQAAKRVRRVQRKICPTCGLPVNKRGHCECR